MLDHERQKYQRMWARPEYRQWSPGVAAAAEFLASCPWITGDTLFDLGCGTGQAGKLLAEAGLKVRLIDLCREAVEVVDLPFTEASLWALPPSLRPADWLFCVDVFEHLPTEYIGQTLDDLARLTFKGGLFKIALFADACGELIGEPLHLTIQSAAWWMSRLHYRWEIVRCEEAGGYLTVMVGRPKHAQ